jgi:hypothetical protein
MKTHKLNVSDKKAALVQLGKLKSFGWYDS